MSEFEKQNEDVFEIVRNNRNIHPNGQPLRIVPENKLTEMVNRSQAAERDLWNANKTIEQLSTDLRAVRFVQGMPIVGAFVVGIILGLIL
jgi:hypothetical protein